MGQGMDKVGKMFALRWIGKSFHFQIFLKILPGLYVGNLRDRYVITRTGRKWVLDKTECKPFEFISVLPDFKYGQRADKQKQNNTHSVDSRYGSGWWHCRRFKRILLLRLCLFSIFFVLCSFRMLSICAYVQATMLIKTLFSIFRNALSSFMRLVSMADLFLCTGKACALIPFCFGYCFMDLKYSHSLAGVSRSTTIAIAYVMTVTDLSWVDAINAIRGARKVANPNFGFQRQLQNYEFMQLKAVILYFFAFDFELRIMFRQSIKAIFKSHDIVFNAD